METFTQIIFPPKPKSIVVVVERKPSAYQPQAKHNASYERDQVYCDLQHNWRPMVDCLFCQKPTKPLEKILELGLGC